MADADFTLTNGLSWPRAHLDYERSRGQTSDAELRVHWVNIPHGALETAVDWIKTNLPTVASPVVEHKTYAGTWRLVSAESVSKKVVDRGVERDITYDSDAVVAIFRYGWITALVDGGVVDYSEARLGNAKELPGNASSIAGIDDTTSDDPERYLYIEWPNCSCDHDVAIIQSFNNVTFTNPAVDGQTYSGTWHIVFATSERADDQSAIIKILLARPQYTLNAYEMYETTWERDKIYLWNVPKDIAQTILDDYKAAKTSASASASYNTNDGLVDLTLSAAGDVADNLTTDAIDITCDTSVVYHFAWGYTKTQLNTFLQAHDDPIPGVGNANEGMTRKIDIRQRSDGLFDAIVEERTFGPHSAPATPDFTLTVPVGTVIERVQSYGWNLRYSELATVKAVYETTVEVGKTVEFRITREDDCSFDYEAAITTVDAIVTSSDIAIGALAGLGFKTEVGKYASAEEILALASGYTSAARTRIEVRLDPRDDETINYQVVKTQVQKVADDLESTGAGVNQKVEVGRNVDAADITALEVTTAARKRLRLVLSPQDDGTLNYEIHTETVLATSTTKATGDTGIKENVYTGRNKDVGDIPTLTSAKRVRPTFLSLSANDDGTYDWLAKEITVQNPTASAAGGRKYFDIDWTWALNQDAVVAAVQPTAVGQSLELNAKLNDDGTVDYVQTVGQKAAVATDVQGGSLVKTLTWTDAKGDISGGHADVAATIGTSTYFTIKVYDDGSVDYEKTVITSNARLSTDNIEAEGSHSITLAKLCPKATSNGYTDTAIIFRNVHVADIPDVTTGGTTYGYIESIKMEDDFTFSGIAIIRVYDSDPSGIALPTVDDLTVANSHDYQLVSYQYDSSTPGSWTRRALTHIVEEWWETDYQTAADRMNEATSDSLAMVGSKISYERVAGVWYFHVVRIHPPSLGSWA